MTPALAALLGALAMLAATVALAAWLDAEMREILLRLACLPVALVLLIGSRHIERLPRVGRIRARGITEELAAGRFEHRAWGAAGPRWALLIVKRVGDELPPKADRTP